MKSIPFKTFVLATAMSAAVYAQEFKTAVQEFKADANASVTIKASYAEIEIEEWNKNKIEVQGIMNIQGLPAEEAKNVFKNWNIHTEATNDKIIITSSSSSFDNEYFFIHNDKYLGNVMVDIPQITAHVFEALDSIHFVLPEIEEFPDLNYNYNYNFNFDSDSMAFDYEEFKKNSEYLKEWQERNKEELERLKEELKANQAEMHKQQKEMEKQIRIITEEAMREKPEKPEKIAKEEMKAREYEIQKILEKRQNIKVKKVLRIKVPKNARLEMDVDYCKITTI